MKTVNKNEVKLFIYDILMFSDEVDNNGNRIPHTSFPKELFRDYRTLKDRLVSHMDVVLYDAAIDKKDLKDTDLVYVPTLAYLAEPAKYNVGKAILYEAFKRVTPLEITRGELEVIKYYYGKLKEIKNISLEDFELFEELIK